MKKITFALGLLLLTFVPACATSFQGDANISVADCTERCERIGWHMDSYVYMGQYSTACVCRPVGSRASNEGGSAGSTTAAVAGVWMQMQRRQQQQ